MLTHTHTHGGKTVLYNQHEHMNINTTTSYIALSYFLLFYKYSDYLCDKLKEEMDIVYTISSKNFKCIEKILEEDILKFYILVYVKFIFTVISMHNHFG